MHSNPFSSAGYDLRDLEVKINRKADEHEVSSLRSDVHRLENSLRETRSEVDGLRRRCEILEESCREMIEQRQQDNSQFGVGA